MSVRFLGRSTGGGGCPTLLETERGTFLVQGWRVTDLADLQGLAIAHGDLVVEIPKSLLRHLPQGFEPVRIAGSAGSVNRRGEDGIALLETRRGTYLVVGWPVSDPADLKGLDIPEHETVVEVPGSLLRHLPEEAVVEAMTDQEWTDLFRGVKREACHLEMRDHYGVGDEAAMFADFRAGRRWSREAEEQHRAPWLDLMRETTARGVAVRRARIVSLPLTEYLRFEHAGTYLNIEAGESVRWLPRRHASALALPGNDLWLLDGERVLFNLFTGDGDWAGQEMTEDPAVAELARTAFESVWTLATPHQDFQID